VTTLPERTPAQVQEALSPTSTELDAYSHSIINEPSKLLIRGAVAAAPQTFTVIFTVKLSSTSIGGGLRAIRPNLTLVDSTTKCTA